MSTSVIEAFGSRSHTEDQNHERIYYILGADDYDTALSALTGTAPASVGLLVRGKCQVEPLAPYGEEVVGAWLGTVPYRTGSASVERTTPLAIGEIRVLYNTGGGTQHIQRGIAHVKSYNTSGHDAGDPHNGFINVESVDGKATANGVDIILRQMDLDVTVVYDSDDLPSFEDIYALTTLYNNAAVSFTDTRTEEVFTFAAGELLYGGASGPTTREDGGFEMSHKLLASPNVTTYLPPFNVTKKGWDYLWMEYNQKDGTDLKVYCNAIRAHVDRVYGTGDFSVLNFMDIGS